ncbi:TPA: hypothetical protein DIV49_03700 [Candidatus Saccharibacteria bacterium]|nr:hypothetical protein [Candidatus Saccharibacteria bacterium]HRJ90929.1 hypothetical protein [Candidatus Saccharibacteria bacterium]
MTTGDPTPPDFDFDAIIQASGVAIESSRDKGLVDFEANRAAVEREVNTNGGIMSPYYTHIAERLNELWEFHEQVATVCGRVYLKDEHDATLKFFIGIWGEPSYDERGTYWVCTDARLQSFGVIDVAREKDEDQNARFVYAFGLEGDEEDDPCLVVYHDTAVVEYDTITDLQVSVWLQETYPELFTELNQIIEVAPSDYTTSLQRLRNMMRQIQTELSETHELGTNLSRYVTKQLAFSKELPCVLELVPGEVFEVQDDDGTWAKLDFPEGSSEIITTPEIDIAADRAGIMAGFPDESGAYARVGYIPLDAVGRLYATVPKVSVLDRAIRGISKDVDNRLENLGAGDVRLTPVETTESSARQRFEHMQLAQDGLNEMYALAINFTKTARYATAQEAHVHAAEVGSEISRRALQTGVNNYRIVVSGIDVVLPPKLEVHGTLSEDDDTHSDNKGLQIVSIEDARSLEAYEESLVSLVGIIVKPVQIEGDPDIFSAEFYVRGTRASQILQPYEANEVPVVDVLVHEVASIPLEGTAKLSIDGYERAKEIFEQIEKLKEITRGGTLTDNVTSFYDAIVDAHGVDTLSPEGILYLQAAAEYYSSSDNTAAKDSISYILGLMLNSSTVELKTLSSGKDDTLHGTIIDVSKLETGEDLTVTVEDEANNLHKIPLQSIAAMVIA